jgi:antitoxin Phd
MEGQIMEWVMAEAKNRFSELMNQAISDGPQFVRRRNGGVVVVSEEQWERVNGKRPDFIEYLMNGPGFEGLDLTRDQSPGRDVDL